MYNSYHSEVEVSFVYTELSRPEQTNEILHEGELSTMHENEHAFFHDDNHLISKAAGSDFYIKKASTLNLVFIGLQMTQILKPSAGEEIIAQYREK